MKRDLQKRPTRQTYKRDKRLTKETNKRGPKKMSRDIRKDLRAPSRVAVSSRDVNRDP